MPYLNSPSGIPFVQFSLICLLEFFDKHQISLERIVETMCHTPAKIYGIIDRGYVEEGFFADLCIVDPKLPYFVNDRNILSKCGWSPLEGMTFKNSVDYTFVNGNLLFEKGRIYDDIKGMKPVFRN
jgi:dihydroorotase